MAGKEVFIDTNIFTNIVDDIQNAAAGCVLSDEPLGNMDVMAGTDAGRKMMRFLRRYTKRKMHIDMKHRILFRGHFAHLGTV